MPHGDLAQLAAVVGALGCLLVLLPRRRALLFGGFAVLAAAEAMLAVALIPRSDLERLHQPLVLLGLVLIVAACLVLATALARWPALAPVALLLAAPVGAFIALSGLSLLWTQDLKEGSIELVFFLFPFAALFAIVARTPFPHWLPRALGVTLLGLTTAFALIGLYQRATHTLLYAPSLEVENAFTSYFRVSSVFKDPSLFGRYLALGIAVIVAAYLLGRVRLAIAAPLLAVFFAALWFSYSQSSMVTIFVVVTSLALAAGSKATRQVVLAVAATVVLAAVGVVAVHVRNDSARKFTSDRSRLVAVTWKVFRNHPLVGVGVGGQPKASREEAAQRLAASRNRSHTTPLTVAAELGVLGLIAYLVFLAGAARALLVLAHRDRPLAVTLAAVFATLLIHSLFYASFFEDPIPWGSLAIAAAALTARYRTPRECGDGGGTAEDIANLERSPADHSAQH